MNEWGKVDDLKWKQVVSGERKPVQPGLELDDEPLITYNQEKENGTQGSKRA